MGDAPTVPDETLATVARCSRLGLVLDLDGVLLRHVPAPPHAWLGNAEIALVAELASLAATHVAIVSRRRRVEVDAMLGRVPGVWLLAESGAWRKPPAEPWVAAAPEVATDTAHAERERPRARRHVVDGVGRLVESWPEGTQAVVIGANHSEWTAFGASRPDDLVIAVSPRSQGDPRPALDDVRHVYRFLRRLAATRRLAVEAGLVDGTPTRDEASGARRLVWDAAVAASALRDIRLRIK